MNTRVKLNRQIPKPETNKGSLNLDNRSPDLPDAELGSRNNIGASRKNINSEAYIGSELNLDNLKPGRPQELYGYNEGNTSDPNRHGYRQSNQAIGRNDNDDGAGDNSARRLQRMRPVQAAADQESKIFKWMFFWIILLQLFNLGCLGVSIAGFSELFGYDDASSYSELKSVISSAMRCDSSASTVTSFYTCGSPNFEIGKYDGTNQGCYCSGVFTVGSSCGSGCTAIPAIGTTSFYNWKNVSFCGSKVSVTLEQSCSGSLASINEAGYVCSSVGSVPVSDVSFVMNAGGSYTAPSGYSSLLVTSSPANYLVYYQSSNSLNVFSGFELSYNKPCLARTNSAPRTTFTSPHPLEKSSHSGCGKYGYDPNTILIDSYTEKELFDDNGLNYTNVTGLSNYVTNQPIYLYARFNPKLRASAGLICYYYDASLCNLLTSGDFDAYRQYSIMNQYINLIISFVLLILFIIQTIVLVAKKDYGYEKYFFQKLITYSTWCLGVFYASQIALSQVYFSYSSEQTQISSKGISRCYANENLNIAFLDFSELMLAIKNVLMYVIINFSFRGACVLISSFFNWYINSLNSNSESQKSPRSPRYY